MSNSAVLQWNSSGSRVVQSITAPRWQEVNRGLQLAGLGYLLALTLVLPALSLIWMSRPWPKPFPVPAGLRDNEELELLGLLVTAVAGPTSSLMILLGQWRCLKHSPQGHNAKELLFASINCILVGPLLLVVAHYLGGARNYALYLEGLEGWRTLEWLHGGTLLQLAGLALLLLNCLFFAQFLRASGECLAESAVLRAVDCYSFFLFLLLGGSVGTVFCGHSFASGRTVVPVLLVSWLCYFLWHLILVFVVRRHISSALLGLRGEPRRKA